MTTVGSTDQGPSGALKNKINEDFGSFEEMQKQFTNAAATRFGSGWAWLGVKEDGSLGITSTPNQGIFIHFIHIVFNNIKYE